MSPGFERLAVLGLGLLGGSLAWAVRERGLAREVVGSGRRREALEGALRRGIADRVEVDPGRAAAGADLLVLATPVEAMAELLQRVAPLLAPGALVTDVGSVKGVLAETLPGLLPAGACYVGSHPMAGGHRGGVDRARPDLFEGATCVVTPGPDTDPRAQARIEALWRALGARLVLRAPAAHDLEVAWVSHVPHALAFAFGRALASAPPRSGEVAGPGFRDFTRIARSDPELWSGILDANRKALAEPLARVGQKLAELVRVLEAGDARTAARLLAEGRAALERMLPEAGEGGQTGVGRPPRRTEQEPSGPATAARKGERSSA